MTSTTADPTVPLLFYSTAQAAQALGVSTDLVRSMISKGELKARKFGTRIIIPVSEIEKAGKPIRTYQH